MVRLENHLGTIDISHEFLVNLVGGTAVNCFGVAGMAPTSVSQGLRGYLTGKRGQKELDRGIRVRYLRQKLTIDLHIIVTYGMNISAVVQSITNKVRYTVEETTGIPVHRVNVFVDGMHTE
ncbi:MAG TPA: Asp23/Gls24 family envelope stress response protein [Firmicutes bacterium]|nr:Asp23/Gls24 family envelope stress response protein [Bacillota bacterium]